MWKVRCCFLEDRGYVCSICNKTIPVIIGHRHLRFNSSAISYDRCIRSGGSSSSRSSLFHEMLQTSSFKEEKKNQQE